MPGRRDERFDSTLPLRLEQGEGVVRNVSASGIYFETDAALAEGEPLRFTLDFRSFPGGPVSVNCIARVVRVEDRGKTKGVAVSINSFEFYRKPKEQDHG